MSMTGLAAGARVRLHRELPFIAAYHRIVDRLDSCPDALPAMEISVATLEKHLDWMGKHFEIVSLDDLATRLNRRARTKPLAAITFDDGYSDVFHHGLPLLRRKGIPAGIFVVTDLVGTTELPIHERLYAILVKKWPVVSSVMTVPPHIRNPFEATQHLLRNVAHDDVLRFIERLSADGGNLQQSALLRPLTWEMLEKMRDAGMTIGSHSKTHPFLTNETRTRVLEEAADSRAVLEERLRTNVSCFAYPGGDFNGTVVEAVHAAGYGVAFTICRHREPRYPMLTVPRTSLWERSTLDRFGRFSSALMSCHAAGMLGSFSNCPNSH